MGTSRAHVELSREGGEYVLKDLGSRNGTILKGESMVPYKEYPFEGGGYLCYCRFGRLSCVAGYIDRG
ncbi:MULTISPECIES: FHA domain-containing protein [Paenibacillus]|uniref:FHA domain-containing protein n=1 Tax=Paenibacillus TaxID=44249 RepID=UPI001F23CA93|nr:MULTISPECIES: FHA domain-containing protein [Paenibacillus]